MVCGDGPSVLVFGVERDHLIFERIDAEAYEAACEAKRLFDNFTEFVRERRNVRLETEADIGGTAGVDADTGAIGVDTGTEVATTEFASDSPVDSSTSS